MAPKITSPIISQINANNSARLYGKAHPQSLKPVGTNISKKAPNLITTQRKTAINEEIAKTTGALIPKIHHSINEDPNPCGVDKIEISDGNVDIKFNSGVDKEIGLKCLFERMQFIKLELIDIDALLNSNTLKREARPPIY